MALTERSDASGPRYVEVCACVLCAQLRRALKRACACAYRAARDACLWPLQVGGVIREREREKAAES